MDFETFAPEASSLFWEISEIAGHHHVTCVDRARAVRGSGFHADRTEAKKRAFVELNERYLMHQIVIDQIPGWGIEFDASGSGFAAGYEERATKKRALLEAVERWTLARWVDERCALPRAAENDSPLRKRMRAFYQEVSLYHLPLSLLVEREIVNVHVAVLLGWSESGVFAGYGTKLTVDEAVDHAHVEAYRNFVIYKNQPPRAQFPYDRIRYFAENKQTAIDVLAGMKDGKWNPPSLKMWKAEKFGEIFLARAIMNDWKPWQHGSVTRFLY